MSQSNELDNPAALEGSHSKLNQYSRMDFYWSLAIYGTAVGAGTLFLPIDVGIGGLWVLVAVILLGFPMIYYCHRVFMRYVLASPIIESEFTEVVAYDFGKVAARWVTLLYLFVIFPILFIYSVGITNTVISFAVNQLNIELPSRGWVALILIGLLMLVGNLREEAIIKVMSVLVYPFALCLIIIACYLIPFWNMQFVSDSMSLSQTIMTRDFWGNLWLTFPVMMFAFSHTPILSQFTFAQKKLHGQYAQRWAHRVLKVTHILIILWVMFFVVSTILTLTPQQLMQAKLQNITILSYLANELNRPFIALIGPLISFIAISKSFLGHHIGAREGLNGLIKYYYAGKSKKMSQLQISRVSTLIIFFVCWLVATLNPSILKLIEILAGPVTALVLCLIPIYAIYRIPRLRKEYGSYLLSNGFVVLVACITISAVFYNLLFRS